jgi:predicted Ser/Thr protein kinase
VSTAVSWRMESTRCNKEASRIHQDQTGPCTFIDRGRETPTAKDSVELPEVGEAARELERQGIQRVSVVDNSHEVVSERRRCLVGGFL